VLAVCETTDLHAGNLARTLVKDVGLKGGGNNRQAQLGGAQSDRLNEYLESLLNAI
jgi:alanyl-tRNA synthetase